jgi:hypothetical protein
LRSSCRIRRERNRLSATDARILLACFLPVMNELAP